jgi:hypothetical protein
MEGSFDVFLGVITAIHSVRMLQELQYRISIIFRVTTCIQSFTSYNNGIQPGLRVLHEERKNNLLQSKRNTERT